MRSLLVVVASAALALPGLAWAASRALDDGTLSVRNGDGVVFVAVRGTLIGTCDNCKVSIVDPSPDDGAPPVVSGYEGHKDLGDTHDIYSGKDVRFRMVGGFFKVKVSGYGIDLAVVAKGWGRIQAYDSNTGTYSVNGDPRRLLPADREVFVLTS
ncbi:MAG TPA: hypothetical protein VE596_05625 [Gaiellaceae bacterium]|jgi:hypothetical protein|nr:hypothetical protein [Gaiellaceae bacterium]